MMPHLPALMLLAAGCAPATDANLVVSGFDGLTLPGEGYWIRQRIWWTDGSNPDEIENILVLASDLDPCAAWDETTSSSWTTTGDPVADCERERDSYAARAGRDVPDSLYMELVLWARDGREPHIGVEPVAGTYAHDEADVWLAFYGRRVVFDWYQEVADALDCTAAEPWSTVRSQEEADTQFDAGAGSLVLDDPHGDELTFELDQLEVLYAGGTDTPGGVLDGVGVFRACDVDRAIEPSSTTD